MMLRLCILVLLNVFIQKAYSQTHLVNTWHCFSEYKVGDIENLIRDQIVFDKNWKYRLSTNITFIDTNKTTSELVAFLDGDYGYIDGSLEYKTVRNIDIQVKSDGLGMLTAESIENLRNMLSQNSEVKYETLKLSQEVWVSQNSITGEKITCDSMK